MLILSQKVLYVNKWTKIFSNKIIKPYLSVFTNCYYTIDNKSCNMTIFCSVNNYYILEFCLSYFLYFVLILVYNTFI